MAGDRGFSGRGRDLPIYPLVQKFSTMVRSRKAEEFEGWLKESLSCGVKVFETFAIGLRRERPAVEAALTLPYSNGQTARGR